MIQSSNSDGLRLDMDMKRPPVFKIEVNGKRQSRGIKIHGTQVVRRDGKIPKFSKLIALSAVDLSGLAKEIRDNRSIQLLGKNDRILSKFDSKKRTFPKNERSHIST